MKSKIFILIKANQKVSRSYLTVHLCVKISFMEMIFDLPFVPIIMIVKI
jgi:hypothetical protein